MVRRTGFDDLHCLICGAKVESLFNLFRECQGVKAIAFSSNWGFKVDCWVVNNIVEMISSCISLNTGAVGDRDGRWHSVFFSSLLYYCWFYRNKLVHEGGCELSKIVTLFNRIVEEGLKDEVYSDVMEDAMGKEKRPDAI